MVDFLLYDEIIVFFTYYEICSALAENNICSLCILGKILRFSLVQH